MVPPINELDGFEVFIPVAYVKSNAVLLFINTSGCRISKPGLGYLRFPEYVNAFFDRNTKRLMITAADKRMPNAIRLSKTLKMPCRIDMNCFRDELEKVCGQVLFERGKNYYIEGKVAKAQQPSLIFDLNNIERKKGRME
jgi:hypothetical protein